MRKSVWTTLLKKTKCKNSGKEPEPPIKKAMKKYLINSALLIMTLILGIIYGIAICKHKVFPYRIIRTAYQDYGYGRWSIGIYEGSTPFDLAVPEDVSNPVLTKKMLLV